MFCHNCGKQIMDGSKFCSYCGADQSSTKGTPGQQTPGTAGGQKNKTIAIVLAAAAILGAVFFFGGREEEKEEPLLNLPTQAPTTEAPTQTPETQSPTTEAVIETTLLNGWQEDGGRTCYYVDGEAMTGLQEIGDSLYYFAENGSLVTSKEVDYNGILLRMNAKGLVTAFGYSEVPSDWAEDKYRHGNAQCGYREMSFEVEDCTSFEFYLEAEGNYGANVNGEWLVYIRSNGTWKHVKTFTFSEPSDAITIRLDGPTDFDAIVAYPTKRGNASYGAYFTVREAWCD